MMNAKIAISLIGLMVLAACSSTQAEPEPTIVQEEPAEVEAGSGQQAAPVEAEPAEVEAEATEEAAAAQELAVTSTEDLAGVYRGRGSALYQIFEDGGTLYVSETQENYTDNPVAVATFWFEDDLLHLEKHPGPGPCGPDVGVYSVWRLKSGRLRFDPVDDECVNRVFNISGNREGQFPVVVEWWVID